MTELKYTFSRVNIMEPIARCINVMQEGSAQGDDKFREEIERGVAKHTLHSRVIAALFVLTIYVLITLDDMKLHARIK